MIERQTPLLPVTRITGSTTFEAAWRVYPDRHVGQNKRDALRQWQRRVKEGHTEATMLEGTRRYAEYCQRTRISGTEYVMQPCRFYGRDCHFELPWELNGGMVQAARELSTQVINRLKAHEAESLQPDEAKAKIRELVAGLCKAKQMPDAKP